MVCLHCIKRLVSNVFDRCKGAYAVVVMIVGIGLLAFRDRCGIRPLIYGTKDRQESGDDYTSHMFASESVALDALGFELVRNVNPGEAIYIDADGKLHAKQCTEVHEAAPCIFEHVYLARPDSFMDDISVYRARLRMGEKLGAKIQREWPDHDIDVVIPIPDTSATSAIELATKLNVKLRHGFVKNRYIGRTFIMPGQQMRKKSVKQKLNAIDIEFKDKNVLLVDDSIVRGTTSQQIVEMAREAGAKKVYFASAAPEVKYPNVYGIDMPSAKELIAHGKTVEEINQLIGSDKLIFQDLEDLIETCREGNPKITRFDTSVFNGHYITGDIDDAYLEALDNKRNDMAKNTNDVEKIEDETDEADSFMELHNVGES